MDEMIRDKLIKVAVINYAIASTADQEEPESIPEDNMDLNTVADNTDWGKKAMSMLCGIFSYSLE